MMENKRTRAWRRHQARRVFKARLHYAVVCRSDSRKRWFELASEKWVQPFRTTGTPCSCWLCKGERYNRRTSRNEERRIVQEYLTDSE